jgi:hypothetical protein
MKSKNRIDAGEQQGKKDRSPALEEIKAVKEEGFS